MIKKNDDYFLKCPDCGGDVKFYHGNGGTRIICKKKCKGYKVIASRGFRDQCFKPGDIY